MFRLASFIVPLWLLCFPAFAEEAVSYRSEIVAQAELVGSVYEIQLGKPFTVFLRMALNPGWHTYTDPPGDAGLPVTIDWTLPAGFKAGGIEWPKAETFREGNLTTYGYSGNVSFPVTITPPESGIEGEITLKATANWLACKDICVPETAQLVLRLPVAASSPVEVPKAIISKTATENYSLPFVLLLALAGGVILNLMPCVFPVLSLKCLAVVKQGEVSRKAARVEGVAYALGILISFATIAGLLIVLKQAGYALGWGFQMQSPVFVSAMALLLFAIGLSLSGVFALPALLGRTGLVTADHSGFAGSFSTGVLAALVATPCTAPFMAAAIGYALAQPAVIALLIFEALGFGLALPFLLVSWLPRLRALLPKPGAWMLRLKEILAFPMYLSAVWLLWVLARQSGADAAMLVLTAAVLLALLLWLLRHRAGWIAALLAAALVVTTLHQVSRMEIQAATSLANDQGEVFNIERIEELRRSGKGVFVNATAAWCITCQVNEKTTLGTERVQRFLAERNIVYMIADWTRSDPAITEFLQSFGRRGVPLYVYYPSQGEPVLLPQLLTPQIVEAAIDDGSDG